MDQTRSSSQLFLKSQLDVATAQNARLCEENALLRHKLNSLTIDGRSTSIINVEAKLKAFQLEGERDRMHENLEKLKRKYNQLHEAYLQKVKRCKALEDVFRRQKTLNGLVMKSTVEQQQKERSAVVNTICPENIANIEKLQIQLKDAYEIIDELEFELESVDYLEMENQRLQTELNALRKEKPQRTINRNILGAEGAQANTAIVNDVTNETDDNGPPPAYDEFSGAQCSYTDSLRSSLNESIMGDMDPYTMERCALTESLIKTAESESNCLRRELLRSRLQRTLRPVRPTSSDA